MDRKKRLQAYSKNLSWYVRNADKLREDSRYKDRFIAVHDSGVLAVDDDPESLWQQLRELAKPDCVRVAFVEYVSSSPAVRVL